MIQRRTFLAAAAFAVGGGLSTKTSAASPDNVYTSIRVTDMHCSTCAKKIAAKLYGVSGVVEVRASVKSNTAFVKPQQKKTPSPRALWEAVEAAGFKPVELSGPTGKFTSKPQS